MKKVPVFAGAPDYQAVFLWEYVRLLDELRDYAYDQSGNMDAGILHGFTSRIEALKNDLAAELPPDPRVLPFKVGKHK